MQIGFFKLYFEKILHKIMSQNLTEQLRQFKANQGQAKFFKTIHQS